MDWRSGVIARNWPTYDLSIWRLESEKEKIILEEWMMTTLEGYASTRIFIAE